MPARGKDWARRRGIGPKEREWNEPWERLRTAIVLRHGLDVDPGRRFERPDEDDTRNLALLLRQASAALDADLTRILSTAAPGLSPIDLDALRRVAEKASAGINLSEYLRVPPVRVSRILDRLERARLVIRVESHLDGRVRRAELTEAGRALLDTIDGDLDGLARLWLDEIDDGAERALLPFIASLAELT
ncbi:hypothetical protein GCM10023168_11580 [Fodinibacter luteus]|uniref:HTH marR-type domain-containing protein n=1 Tax=Fodinibacter luteus TaxID=552064 RepID=A0ABP8K7J4_9MICO